MSEIRDLVFGSDRIDTHSHSEGKLNDFTADVKSGKSSRIAAAGCKSLYGIDAGISLDASAPKELFDKADDLRRKGFLSAFHETMDICKIKTQLVFTHETNINNPLVGISDRIKMIFYIDNIINGNIMYYCPDGLWDGFNYYRAICNHLGNLCNLDDYLSGVEKVIFAWKSRGAVAMKVSSAYTTGLDFSDPPYNEAAIAFSKKEDMTAAEIKTVQDFAMRYAFEVCKRAELPIVIHTGFLVWGHADLRQTNPMHLHKIIGDKRYKDATFVLLHGGNPYVGETTYLAAMFPNVILDFTWISWMTRSRFRFALSEWLEIIPLNKFCWGSDSTQPEDMCGIDYVVREEIANVLEDLISRRIIDYKMAQKFVENSFINTPKRVFHLD